MTINGVKFEHGEVTWVQPGGFMRKQLPEFSQMRADNTSYGAHCSSVGLVGVVGKYYIVVTERDEYGSEYDYTIIPKRSVANVIYRPKK